MFQINSQRKQLTNNLFTQKQCVDQLYEMATDVKHANFQ